MDDIPSLLQLLFFLAIVLVILGYVVRNREGGATWQSFTEDVKEIIMSPRILSGVLYAGLVLFILFAIYGILAG